jgi:hypothetical protein
MSLMSPIQCYLGKHEPDRRKARWNGLTYVGECKYCGKGIERVSHRNWRERGAAEG